MTFVHKDGTAMTFQEVVSSLLVAEHERTKADADALVKRFPQVVMNGIMGGMNYRATATALEMKENEAAERKEE